MGYNFIIFGFPLYLIFFEMLFRAFSQIDTSSFIGPTIGAAGLSLMIPLVRPKSVELNEEEQEMIKKHNLSIKFIADERLINFIWVAVIIGILIWYWSCATSFVEPKETIWIFPKHFIIGMANYVIGLILAIYKEII